MKIVLVSAYYPPENKGGAEISTHLLAQGLQKRGHEVCVITEGKDNAGEVDGIEVKRLVVGLRDKPLWEHKKSRAMAKILRGLNNDLKQADVIHANDFRSVLGLMEWRKLEKQLTTPIIATIRDYALISGSTNFLSAQGNLPASSVEDAWTSHRIAEATGLRRWARWWQYRGNINYRKARFNELDGQIYISNRQAELIKKVNEGQEVRSIVIYNPVADNFLTTRTRDGYDGNVLYIGTVEYYKGVGLLLDSWRRIVKEAPQATLRIVGEGNNRVEYEKAIERAGLRYSVKMVGRVKWNQIISEYDRAQIVVAPHIWYEPFGRTVAEGMARGKVVVTAGVGGPSEMIDDGKTGLLFERNQEVSLSDALLKALKLRTSERKRMGGLAHAWVAEHLNKNHIASLHEDFYKEVRRTNAN